MTSCTASYHRILIHPSYLYTPHIFWQRQLTFIIQSICTNENLLFQNSYSRNPNMGFHFLSLPTRSAFTKLQKAKVKQMHCTACHESHSLVLTGGTSATDVSREGTMCILWCLRDFRLTQHTDMHMNIKLKLFATSWYTLCTYILSYSNQLLKLNFCLKYSMCIQQLQNQT